jgi:hypothetical protein
MLKCSFASKKSENFELCSVKNPKLAELVVILKQLEKSVMLLFHDFFPLSFE